MNFTGEIIRREDTPAGLERHLHDDPSDYLVHIHASVSHGEGIVNGGGFRGATVYRGVNIYVLEYDEDEV